MSRSVKATNRETFQAIYPGASQRVAVAATSTVSLAVADATSIVELFATADCWVVFGAHPGDSPVAVANDGTSMFFGQGLFKYYGIQPDAKVAVIASGTATGFLHIIEGKY